MASLLKSFGREQHAPQDAGRRIRGLGAMVEGIRFNQWAAKVLERAVH